MKSSRTEMLSIRLDDVYGTFFLYPQVAFIGGSL